MKIPVLFFVLFLQQAVGVQAQSDVVKTLQKLDSLFWIAYNTCEIEKAGPFFTQDVEFYHDKGGLTLGKENLLNSFKNNLCSNPDFRLRREAVEGSVKVFPLRNGNALYGAILSGEHVFYVLEKGKKERLDGLANFSHLWLLKEGRWEMARILSYDHRPAPYVNKRREIQLADDVVARYTGTYKGPRTGILQVVKGDGSLVLMIGPQRFLLYAEKEATYFSKERDLTFEFVQNERGKATKLIVRERGEVVEEAIATP